MSVHTRYIQRYRFFLLAHAFFYNKVSILFKDFTKNLFIDYQNPAPSLKYFYSMLEALTLRVPIPRVLLSLISVNSVAK